MKMYIYVHSHTETGTYLLFADYGVCVCSYESV